LALEVHPLIAPSPWQKLEPATDPLDAAEHSGLYLSDEAETHLRVTSELLLTRPTRPDAALRRVATGTFVTEETPQATIVFTESGLLYSLPGAQRVPFRRIGDA
jgi:hypothetical protein